MSKIKGVDISSLNSRQQAAMKSHSTHHSPNHIKIMVRAILSGKTFTQAHKIAMKLVGQ